MLVDSCISLLGSIHNKEWEVNKISPSLSLADQKEFGKIIDRVFKEFPEGELRKELIKAIEERVSLSPPHSPITKDQFTKIVQESTVDIRSKSPELPSVPLDISSSQEQAATCIQSQFRRYLVQKKLILPKEIDSFISNNFPTMSQNDVKALAKIISRQSILMLENPKAFQGEGKRVNCLVEEKFTDPVTKETKIIKTPRTIWVYLSNDQRQLRVQVYSKKFLGDGTYKTVKASKTLVFDLSGGIDKSKKVVRSVYIKSKDHVTNQERRQLPRSLIRQYEDEDIERLRKSMNQAGRIFSKEELEHDEAIHIKALPEVTHTYTGKKGIKRLEWEEPMYFGNDFLEVTKNGSVEVGDGQTVMLRSLDKLRITKSVLYTAQKMHEKGIIHRDVKGQNVFLSFDGKLQGHLGDFDLVTKIGQNDTESPYAYWDLCSCEGLVLPTVDIFGSAMLLGEAFLDEKFYSVSQMRFQGYGDIEISKKIDRNVYLKSKMLLGEFQNQYSSKVEAADLEVLATALSQLEEEKNSKKAATTIRNHLSKIENPETAKLFKELVAELELLAATGDLLKEVFAADRELNLFLKDRKKQSLCRKLATGGDKQSLTAINDAFPVFKNLHQKISDLEAQWIATVSQ